MPDRARPGAVVGVDLGGTKIAAATVGAQGSVGTLHTVPTPAQDGPEQILDAVAGAVRAVLDGGPRLAGVGIGTAGAVDAGTGTVVSATPTLRGWAGTDVAGGLRARLQDRADTPAPLPVFVENDVDAHGTGESWLGAAAGAGSALLIAVGTGVGAAVTVDGRPWRGAHHLAGDIGHLPVPGADDRVCPCGRPGHLEAVAAGPAVHRGYLERGGDPAVTDARAVVERAARGDVLAAAVIDEAARALGRAVAGMVTLLDPEVVVIGGGLAGACGTWWSTLESTLRSEVVDVLAGLPLRPATLGGTAAVVGAARGAWNLIPGGAP